MSEENTWDWYKPGKSIQNFHESEAFIRVLVGGRGSGKTYGVIMEAVGHCTHNPGARVCVARLTDKSQDASTISKFDEAFGKMGPLYTHTPTSLFQRVDSGRKYRIPSLEAIQAYNKLLATNPTRTEISAWLAGEGNRLCSHVLIQGFFSASQLEALRSAEYSLMILVEADQMPRKVIEYATPSLRHKNAHGQVITDKGLILDTNPPDPDHWIAAFEEEKKDDPDCQFWHITTYENQHNLEPDYIQRNILSMYQSQPAMIERMLWGRYARAFDGVPVFHNFKSIHSNSEIGWVPGGRLVIGLDFGQCNATVIGCRWDQKIGKEIYPHLWILGELYLEQSDTDVQAQSVLEYLEENFQGIYKNTHVCKAVKWWCDPAGAAKTSKGSDLEVLRTHGIYPGFSYGERLQPTIAMVNRLFASKTPKGKPIIQIDEEACPRLTGACRGGYRYPNKGEPGWGTGLPLKGASCGDYDHIADAFRYLVLNEYRLQPMALQAPRKLIRPEGKQNPSVNSANF